MPDAADRIIGAVHSLLIASLAAVVLLWVAFYNGYPTVYPDTGSYIFTGVFRIPLPPFRSPGYGVFLARTSLGETPWFTIVAQALLVVAVLHEACKHAIGGELRFRAYCLLAVVAALAALTSLPWETSLLMPDVFAGVVFLSMFLLSFRQQMNWAERTGLAALLTLGVAAHISLLPIAALFVAFIAAAKLAAWGPRDAPSTTSAVVWLTVPLIVAALWTAGTNRKMGLGFRVSPSGNEFLLGRLFADGLAADFLRENCSKRPLVACRYLNDLPKTPEQFLFWHPLLQEMDGNGDEVRAIVHGTLAAYPFRFAWSSLGQTLRQFVAVRTGDEVRDLALKAPSSNTSVIAQVFPNDLRAYSGSRLVQGRLVSFARVVAGMDTTVFWLSFVACGILAITHADDEWQGLFYSAIAYLLINAAVCATLAGVYDRYQSRVAWLVPLCLVTYACRRLRDRQREAALRGNF